MKFKGNGKSVYLPPAQSKILMLLMCRRWVRRDDIAGVLWLEPDDLPDWVRNTMDAHLTALRASIKRLGWLIVLNRYKGNYTLEEI